jgi:mannose-6-phosphate isomerase-like protein (cupin superfamily)
MGQRLNSQIDSLSIGKVRSPSGQHPEGTRPRSRHVTENADRDGSEPRIRIGREVRRWRKSRALTLAHVSEASGLNLGYLSQIENEKAVPSLDALVAIAGALDVPPAWLLLDSAPPPRVVRAADRPRLATSLGTEATEVDGGTSRDLRILEVVVPPGASTGVHMHSGDEHHLIIEGRWRMTQGDHVVELGPGDYLAWDPTVPHDVENVGNSVGRLLVIYPRHGRRDAGAS